MTGQTETKVGNRVFSAWLEPPLAAQIEELAALKEWSLSKTVKHLIERALNAPNGKKAKRR